jgi:hypothetical protein
MIKVLRRLAGSAKRFAYIIYRTTCSETINGLPTATTRAAGVSMLESNHVASGCLRCRKVMHWLLD